MGNMTRKGRRTRKPFLSLPHDMLASENWKNASLKATRLVLDLGSQYRGNNNGDLCAAWSVMKKRGWKSESTMREALEEALYYSFLELTRQGGKHKASLYAITWEPIHECKGKLDVSATRVASNDWKEPKPLFVPKRKTQLVPRGLRQCTPTVGAKKEQEEEPVSSIAPTIGVVSG